jgi:PAS domain S-box-containing protein
MFRSFPGKRLIIIILAVLAGLLLVIGLFYKKIEELNDTGTMVSHTNMVLYQSEKLYTSLLSSQAALRDYVLTGKPIQVTATPENDITEQVELLRQYIQDNPEQKKYIDSIGEISARLLRLPEQLVAEKQQYGSSSAAALLASVNQPADIENVRQLIRRLQATENAMLLQRKAAKEQASSEVSMQLIWLMLIAGGLLVLFMVAVRRYFNGRKAQLEKDSYASALIENLQDAIISTDRELCIRSWNKGAEMIYGWKEGEVIGMSGPQLLQTRFQSETTETMIALFKKSGYFRGEVEQSTKSGKRIIVQVNSSALFDAEGNFIGAVVVNRDVTEQKKMEQALVDMNQQLEEKIRNKVAELGIIFERITDGFVALDKNWCYSYINQKASQVLGRTAEELIGKNIWETYPESVGSVFYKGFHEAMDQQRNVNIEAFYEPFGRWLETHVYPSPEGISFFLRDITSRKLSEEALRISNERYDFLSKTTNDSIFDWDLQKHELVRINKAIEEMFGYPRVHPAEVDAFWDKTAHPDDWAEIKKKRAAVFADPSCNNWEDEYRFRRSNGEYGYIHARGYVIRDNNGKAIRSIGASQDITEKKKAEDALRKSELLFRTLVEKGSEIIVMINAEGNVTYVSPSSEKVLGYKYEDRIGKNALEHIHPDDIPGVIAALQKLGERPGAVDSANWRHLHADGTWHWLDGVATNLLHDPAIRSIILNFRDITDRKKMEDELLLSETKYKLLFYSSPLAKYIYEVETLRIVEVNRAATQLYGYEQDEFTKLTIRDIRPAEERAKLDKHLFEKRPFESGISDLGVWKHQKKNGEVINVHINGHVIDYNGRKSMVVVCEDITEKMKVQKELEASNERFHYVTQATFDAIWDWQLNKDTVYWGDGFESLFGYDMKKLVPVHSTWENLIHPDDRERVVVNISRAMGDPNCQNWSDEYRFTRADGSYAYVRDKGVLIRDEAGRATRMIGAMQDITKQKEEENRLRLLESVVTYANDSVVVTEAEPITGEHPKIIYVNDSFTKMTGYTLAEVIGKTPRLLQGPDTDRQALDRLKQSMEKWEPCEIEVINYRKNGEAFWNNISISPVSDEKGWFTHWIAIEREVTERKLVEEELKYKNDELKRLSDYLQNIREEERKSIAQEVHEELGQLVSALKIDVDWLTLKMTGPQDPIAEKRVAHANKIMGVLIKTIRKMAANLRPSVLDDFGLVEALQWYCNDFQSLHGIACEFEPEINDEGLSKKTAVEIFRIIQESLSNVREHSGASLVTVALRESDKRIHLTITDDGVGFDMENTKNTLGLVGLRERAVSIHGELKIISAPGKGTRVEAVLPREYSKQ